MKLDLRTKEGRARKGEMLTRAAVLREQGWTLADIAASLSTSPATLSMWLPTWLIHLSPYDLEDRRRAHLTGERVEHLRHARRMRGAVRRVLISEQDAGAAAIERRAMRRLGRDWARVYFDPRAERVAAAAAIERRAAARVRREWALALRMARAGIRLERREGRRELVEGHIALERRALACLREDWRGALRAVRDRARDERRREREVEQRARRKRQRQERAAMLGRRAERQARVAKRRAIKERAQKQRKMDTLARLSVHSPSRLDAPVAGEGSYTVGTYVADPRKIGDPSLHMDNVVLDEIVGDLSLDEIAALDEVTLRRLQHRVLEAGFKPPQVQAKERERLRTAAPHRGEQGGASNWQRMSTDHHSKRSRAAQGKGRRPRDKPRKRWERAA